MDKKKVAQKVHNKKRKKEKRQQKQQQQQQKHVVCHRSQPDDACSVNLSDGEADAVRPDSVDQPALDKSVLAGEGGPAHDVSHGTAKDDAPQARNSVPSAAAPSPVTEPEAATTVAPVATPLEAAIAEPIASPKPGRPGTSAYPATVIAPPVSATAAVGLPADLCAEGVFDVGRTGVTAVSSSQQLSPVAAPPEDRLPSSRQDSWLAQTNKAETSGRAATAHNASPQATVESGSIQVHPWVPVCLLLHIWSYGPLQECMKQHTLICDPLLHDVSYNDSIGSVLLYVRQYTPV